MLSREPGSQSGQRISPARRSWPTWAVRAALVVLSVYLLSPLWAPAHIEGFTASMASLGLHLRDGDLAAYDRLHPVNLEYFALSRLGANLFVAGAVSLLGVSAETALRLLMWVGAALLAAAAYVLTRRWGAPLPPPGTTMPNATTPSGADEHGRGRAAGALVVAVLLLLPGVAESTFAYNDNVISAGLALAGLALLVHTPRRTGWGPGGGWIGGWIAGGVLLGLGVVMRTDAVLLCAALPLIAFEQDRRARGLVLRALACGVPMALVIFGIDAAYGTSPLEVVGLGQYVTYLWHRGFGPRVHLLQALMFVGIPGAVFIALGVVRLLRTSDRTRQLLLLGIPALYNVLLAGKLWEGRQLLPLTPFLAALAIHGLRALGTEWRPSRATTLARLAAAGLTLAVLLAPREPRALDDGPRTLGGRLWSPPAWWRWQQTVTGNLADLRAFLATTAASTAGGPPVAVLSQEWNPDRYVHLMLQESGYHVVPIASRYPACAATAELFARGDQHVLHVRLHSPFLSNSTRFLADRFDTAGQPCLNEARPSAAYLITTLGGSTLVRPGNTVGQVVPNEPWMAWIEREWAKQSQATVGYNPIVAIGLDSARLVQLRRRYSVDSATGQRLDLAARVPVPAPTFADAQRLLASRTKHFAR